MSTIVFEKWEGLGNDFVVVDASVASRLGEGRGAWVRAVCDRHLGVGADGVLFVTRSPATMVVVNADGSEPEMCGNGLRCAVGWLAASLGEASGEAVFGTGAGSLGTRWARTGPGQYAVEAEMGRVSFDPSDAAADARPTGDAAPVALETPWGRGWVASTGNPHWVFLQTPRELAPDVGPQLEHDGRFLHRTNVELVERLGPGRYGVTVWERGCGLTMACGTGATAVAGVLVALGREPADTPIRVELPGGALEVRVAADGAARMTGPARRVFVGELPGAG